MAEHRPPGNEHEIELVDDQPASFKGSGYDARLAIDTTPTSRVEWAAQEQPNQDQRSAYDAKLAVDTTPSARIEPVTAPSATADSTATPSSDQQSAT